MDFAKDIGLFAAVFAALGYVGKLVIEWIKGLLDEQRKRRAQLVQLQSLLRAGLYTFRIQMGHVKKLVTLIEQRTSNKLMTGGEGYDQFFTDAYDKLTQSEKELHGIIRALTIHAMRSINASQLKWLQDDTYFKAQRGDGPLGKLAVHLANLEVHLILWLAKYEAWMPNCPAHALVFLADEKDHGVGFPTGIDALIAPARKAMASSRLGRWEGYSDCLRS